MKGRYANYIIRLLQTPHWRKWVSGVAEAVNGGMKLISIQFEQSGTQYRSFKWLDIDHIS